MLVRIKKLHDNAIIPQQMTPDSACVDIYACTSEPVVITNRQHRLVKTGFAIEIPQGYEGQIRPRSGLALKYGVTVLNSPGTIDCGFRGEVGVILVNFGKDPFVVYDGNRIAQLAIRPTGPDIEFELVKKLSDTERGSGGFGSTGV